MPDFLSFQQGNESRDFFNSERQPRTSRLKTKSSIGNLVDSISRATGAAYGAIIGGGEDGGDGEGESSGGGGLVGITRRFSGYGSVWMADTREILNPKRGVVEKLVRTWWSRAIVLMMLPAGVVCIPSLVYTV